MNEHRRMILSSCR